MSTDIQSGKLPPIVGKVITSKSQQQGTTVAAPSARSTAASGSADTVSMTDQAARLQKVETVLAAMPKVNPQLVAEMKQAIADGSLDMDYAGTAAKLIEMESGKSVSDRSES